MTYNFTKDLEKGDLRPGILSCWKKGKNRTASRRERVIEIVLLGGRRGRNRKAENRSAFCHTGGSQTGPEYEDKKDR